MAAIACLAACARKADTKPLDQAGVRHTTIQKLHEMNVTDNEVAQVVKARGAGMHDQNCLELVQLARGRGIEFNDGDAVAVLFGVQFSEEEVMQLARINQLGLWIGEVQAMRFAGVNKPVIFALANMRSKARPVPSGPNIVRLQDAGLSDNEMIELIERVTTDAEAAEIARIRKPKGGTQFRRL
jgi:hypothetical protein